MADPQAKRERSKAKDKRQGITPLPTLRGGTNRRPRPFELWGRCTSELMLRWGMARWHRLGRYRTEAEREQAQARYAVSPLKYEFANQKP